VYLRVPVSRIRAQSIVMSSPPFADADSVSRELSRRLAADIDAAGGCIGFDAWMQRALYEPGLGYYSGPLRKFGAEGDFVTAPEMSPLFGHCVAGQIAQWFEHCDATVIEFGAGSGRLAASVLAGLEALGRPVHRYLIVDLSADLRARQRETLQAQVPHLLERVEWLDALPERIDGVVLGNELLDAMPVRVFEVRREPGQTELLEQGVGLTGQAAPSSEPAFAWQARGADAELRAAVQPLMPWFDGVAVYRSEVGLQGQAWVRTVGARLVRGAVLLLDYGFPAREYYHPHRSEGTLMAHRRHRAHPDVLAAPGLQDITAHVDFSAVARAGEDAGLDLLGYTSQARFLLNCGLLEALAREQVDEPAPSATVAQVRRLAAVQTLLSESEMGELFKVIALGRGLLDEALGFARGDRRAAL
jgi:SAM-dependent MidA family methyltransferase